MSGVVAGTRRTDVRVILIAAGEGSRWGDHTGVPKHLVRICGEVLLERTVRQFSEHGDVVVVGRDERYEVAGARLLVPDLEPTNYGADKFLSSRRLWSRDGRTLVAYGDVRFSDEAVSRIVSHESRDWRLFARFGPSSVYGGDRGECFAQSFWPNDIGDHLAALRLIVRLRQSRVLGQIGGWQHYRAMEGLFLDEHARGPRFVEIDDETDDLDYPEDLARIEAVVTTISSAEQEARHNMLTSGIVPT